jgi:lipoyl(octanoyl) transferase
MNWSLLPTISAPMPLQMALDELLFESQKKDPRSAPVLRFYVSSSPWISTGCSFKDSEALSKSDLVLMRSQVPVCSRITGGGCVLHGEDLIFSLIVRYGAEGSLLSAVRSSYAKIHESVRMGLQACGLDPKFYSCEEKLPKGSDCFDFPVESDLSWRGKKIAGGAQKRSEGVLLHHESIQIPVGVERENLIAGIKQGFEKVFGVTIQDADLDPGVYFQAGKGISGKC